MNVRTAVITAAAPEHAGLLLRPLIDLDGVRKSTLAILLDDVRSAGIEDVVVVVSEADREAVEQVSPSVITRVQGTPRGYGDALLQARDVVGDDACLHLVGDHLFVSRSDVRCAAQLVEVATREGSAVSAVQATREHKLGYYGAVGGRLEPGTENLYRVEAVLEKPTPTVAEQRLVVPGLRTGHYLCFFGLHVLTPQVFEALQDDTLQRDAGDALSRALGRVASRERLLAFEIDGTRQNLGLRYGPFHAQLALALAGVDREGMLADLLEAVAQRPHAG